MALGTQLIFQVQVPPGLNGRKLTKHDLLEYIIISMIHLLKHFIKYVIGMNLYIHGDFMISC